MSSMESKGVLTRLLELQERFESYSTLHREELQEIRETLDDLRRDVLDAGGDGGMDQGEHTSGGVEVEGAF